MAKRYRNIAEAIGIGNMHGMAYALSQGAKDMQSASAIQKKYVEDMGIIQNACEAEGFRFIRNFKKNKWVAAYFTKNEY